MNSNSIILISFLWLLAISRPVDAQQKSDCDKTFNKKTEKLYDEGMAWFKKKNYFEANRVMKEVVRQEPEFVDAWYIIGVCNFKKSDPNYKEAERCFQKVVTLCPGYDLYTYYYLGELCYGSERYDSTIQYLTIFLKDVEKIRTDEDYNRASELLKYSKFYTEMVRNPVPFDPRVVDGISTQENEYLPILTPDNQQALYTREKKIATGRDNLYSSSRTKEKFMFSMRNNDGTFTEGEEMPEPFNINDNEGGAFVTIDNNTLYYTVCKYSKDKAYYNCDIFYSENINGDWSPIKSVSDKINLPYSWESQPSISPDGKTLYFVSDRSGGYGGYDIYRSIKSDNGEWGTPINLGPVINSRGNEKSPFIHPDGKTLYFSSDGWMGLGGYDIFYSRLEEEGNWTKPGNLGYPINSPDDEVGFFVSTDGTKGFFASNKFRGKGGWDLYFFDLYAEARPEKVLFIKGNVKSEMEAEPLQAKIELKDVETKKISEIPLDSNTGNYVAVRPFKNDYIMTVKKAGYVFESRYISKEDTTFRAPAKVDVEIKPIEINKPYRINDVHFPFNSFDLTEDSKAILDQLIEFLNDSPSIAIEIQGHTDNIGNHMENLKLSENRARSVYNYLVANGIKISRLTYKGFGETMPIADNLTDQGRAINRRTIFVIRHR